MDKPSKEVKTAKFSCGCFGCLIGIILTLVLLFIINVLIFGLEINDKIIKIEYFPPKIIYQNIK